MFEPSGVDQGFLWVRRGPVGNAFVSPWPQMSDFLPPHAKLQIDQRLTTWVLEKKKKFKGLVVQNFTKSDRALTVRCICCRHFCWTR